MFPLSSLLHWDGGTYHPSFHCQQKKQHKKTKNRKNNKNNILFHLFVSDFFLFLSLFFFFYPISISCALVFLVSLVNFIAGSPLPPVSACALSFQHLGQRCWNCLWHRCWQIHAPPGDIPGYTTATSPLHSSYASAGTNNYINCLTLSSSFFFICP